MDRGGWGNAGFLYVQPMIMRDIALGCLREKMDLLAMYSVLRAEETEAFLKELKEKEKEVEVEEKGGSEGGEEGKEGKV